MTTPRQHRPFRVPALRAEYCAVDGALWPCRRAVEEEDALPPTRCVCFHAKVTHAGGNGVCHSPDCDCDQFRAQR